jgi:hypothetical protein
MHLFLQLFFNIFIDSSGSSIDLVSLIGGNVLVGGTTLVAEIAKFVGGLST